MTRPTDSGLTGSSGAIGGSINVKRSPLRSVSRFFASVASICFWRTSLIFQLRVFQLARDGAVFAGHFRRRSQPIVS